MTAKPITWKTKQKKKADLDKQILDRLSSQGLRLYEVAESEGVAYWSAWAARAAPCVVPEELKAIMKPGQQTRYGSMTVYCAGYYRKFSRTGVTLGRGTWFDIQSDIKSHKYRFTEGRVPAKDLKYRWFHEKIHRIPDFWFYREAENKTYYVWVNAQAQHSPCVPDVGSQVLPEDVFPYAFNKQYGVF